MVSPLFVSSSYQLNFPDPATLSDMNPTFPVFPNGNCFKILFQLIFHLKSHSIFSLTINKSRIFVLPQGPEFVKIQRRASVFISFIKSKWKFDKPFQVLSRSNFLISNAGILKPTLLFIPFQRFFNSRVKIIISFKVKIILKRCNFTPPVGTAQHIVFIGIKGWSSSP